MIETLGLIATIIGSIATIIGTIIGVMLYRKSKYGTRPIDNSDTKDIRVDSTKIDRSNDRATPIQHMNNTAKAQDEKVIANKGGSQQKSRSDQKEKIAGWIFVLASIAVIVSIVSFMHNPYSGGHKKYKVMLADSYKDQISIRNKDEVSDVFKKGLDAHRYNNYELALEYWRELLNGILKDNTISSAIFNNWGVSLASQIKASGFDDDRSAFGISYTARNREKFSPHEEALQKFETSSIVNPYLFEASYNTGVLLTQLSRRKNRKEANALLRKACDSYEVAARINPSNYEVWFSWGNALVEQAILRNWGKPVELLEDASRKYEKARELNPASYQILFNWGNALINLSWNTKGHRKYSLFNEACEKYKMALEINPDMSRVHFNLNAVTDYYEQRKNDKSKRSAAEMFGENFPALKHNAELQNIYILVKEEAKNGLLREFDPQINALWFKGIKSYANNDYELSARSWEQIAQKILISNPASYSILNNYAAALIKKTESAKRQTSSHLYLKALDYLKIAIGINPKCYEALINWGVMLAKQAKLENGKLIDKTFTEAQVKFEKALEIQPNVYEVYYNLGTLLMERSNTKKDNEQENLLELAKVRCLEAENIKYGIAAYNLACIYARHENEQECKKWLNTGEQTGTLVEREFAMKDSDLKIVRKKDWFKRIRWQGE